MKAKEKRILEITDEIGGMMSYKIYEDLLDQLVLSHLESSEDIQRDKAYWIVMNLKKLLKVICSDFFSFESLSEIHMSEPKTSFDEKLSYSIKENLETDRRWDMIKKLLNSEKN